MQWLTLAVSEVRKLHTATLIYIQKKRYDLNHTGQVIYLQKVLNDAFDPIQRRIFLSDGNFGDRVFLYHRPQKTNLVYFYHRWKNDEVYQIGDIIQHKHFLYQSNNAHQGSDPEVNPDGYWDLFEDDEVILLKRRQEYTAGAGFVINLPADLQYNLARLQAVVDFHKVAARQYRIETF